MISKYVRINYTKVTYGAYGKNVVVVVFLKIVFDRINKTTTTICLTCHHNMAVFVS